MLNEDSSSFVDFTIPSKRAGPGSSWGAHDVKCSVEICSSSTTSCPDLWFYKLPQHSRRSQLRQMWLKQIRLTEFQVHNTLVCEKHFSSSDIGHVCSAGGRRSLKKAAIPTLLLPLHHQAKVRSKPKHVYQRNTLQDTKCVTVINPEEQSNQLVTQNNSIDDNHANNLNTNNNSQMDIDDNPMKNNDDQSSNDNSQINRDTDQMNNNDDQIDNDGNKSDNGNNINNNDDSQNADDIINKEHTNSTDPTLANKSLNSLNNLYLKFKSKKESSKNIYSDEYKLKMFQLYFENTQAYELLQSTLELPAVSALPSYIPSTLDGINNLYISSLIGKIGLMPDKNKFVVICVNVMRIKPLIEYDGDKDEVYGVHLGSKTVPYQYAMVAMVRGIIDEWYHVVSICLLPSQNIICIEYNTFLEKILMKMLGIGLSIKAVVTSADDLFRFASVIKSRPYFHIKNYKMYHIFDPAHLMLLLYDELNHYKVFYSKLDEKITTLAKWEHIQDFYENESTKTFRLTDQSSYINKNESHKNKLKSAVQIFSLKTAMGISMFSSNNMNVLDNDVMETVSFLVRINNIFAALHPKAFQSEHEVIQDENFWPDNIDYIESIKRTMFSKTKSQQVKFPDYLLISMKSVALLQQISYFNEGRSKLMQCLNHDPLVEFINEINLKSFKNRYPSVTELCDTLKHGFMQNNHHNTTNIVQGYSKLENFIENATKLSEENCFIETNSLKPTDMADYKLLNTEDANSMYYIAIYLLDKMYKMYKNALSSRMKHMCSSISYENKLEAFCGSIIVPDNEFLEFVNKMDIIFVTYYKKAMGTGRLFEELMKAMNKMIVTGPVDIAPLQYIKGLFLELRIYHTINYNNELFENDDTDNHQFVACRLNSLGLDLDSHR